MQQISYYASVRMRSKVVVCLCVCVDCYSSRINELSFYRLLVMFLGF